MKKTLLVFTSLFLVFGYFAVSGQTNSTNYIDQIKSEIESRLQSVQNIQNSIGTTTDIINSPEVQQSKEFLNLLDQNPDFKKQIESFYNTKLYDQKGQTDSLKYQEQITFSTDPSVPRPYESVTARIQDFSTNITVLPISWYVNDVLIKKEIGLTKFTFNVGALGEQTKLKVVIDKKNGETFEKSLKFRPAEVDLIYEANTFTPPFYEGKALFSRQSQVKVTAIPQAIDKNGIEISPQKLLYRWYVNGDYVQDSSGYQKQDFYYTAKLLDSNLKVGVEIVSLDDGSVAYDTIVIPQVSPEITVYEKNPLLGTTYNSAIFDSLNMSKPEIELEAVPFYFNKNTVLSGDTVYKWTLNGSTVESPNSSSIVFRNDKNLSGQSSIGIDIKNDTMLQFAKENFKLLFTEASKNFSF